MPDTKVFILQNKKTYLFLILVTTLGGRYCYPILQVKELGYLPKFTNLKMWDFTW